MLDFHSWLLERRRPVQPGIDNPTGWYPLLTDMTDA